MKIAVGIVDLFSGGGLQRDCLEICAILRRRGHVVDLYTARCEPGLVERDAVRELASRALTNHGRDVVFGRAFMAASRCGYDVRVGFNKLPGLDVLYCADRSVAARPLATWQWLLPRHRTMRLLEASCFGPDASTVVLMLSEAAVAEYQAAWGTPSARSRLLPPTISRARIRPELNGTGQREALRGAFGLADNNITWLFVGAQPHTKGLDRVLDALATRPNERLLVAGVGAEQAKAAAPLRLAQRRGVGSRVVWLGHREDIPELMVAADLLVHPARYDMTGQVILEGLAMGLPVVTTAACGFAEHVQRAGAGVVLPEPFDQAALNAALMQAGSESARREWARSALSYAASRDFTRGFEEAANAIETVAARGEHPTRSP